MPVKLGAGGMQEIVQLNLSDEEATALRGSAAAVQELVDSMANMAMADASGGY